MKGYKTLSLKYLNKIAISDSAVGVPNTSCPLDNDFSGG